MLKNVIRGLAALFTPSTPVVEDLPEPEVLEPACLICAATISRQLPRSFLEEDARRHLDERMKLARVTVPLDLPLVAAPKLRCDFCGEDRPGQRALILVEPYGEAS